MSHHRIPLAVGGLLVYGTTTYFTYQYYRIQKMPPPPEGIDNPSVQHELLVKEQASQNITSVFKKDPYNEQAPSYDSEVNWTERLMGISSQRKKLFQTYLSSDNVNQYDVLETSAGTGRMLEYYPIPNLRSLVLSDRNEMMLSQAYSKYKTRFQKLFESPTMPFWKEGADSVKGIPVFFEVQDAESLKFQDGTFDAVVDTFGLCSHADPVAALKEMGRVCKGKILLLQHGKSSYEWLNEVLDKTSLSHALKWGCWWNRDIVGLVKSAGLKIEHMERSNFGTTYLIVASSDNNV
jgi:methyltransferase OMS1, mitochondrial